MSNRLCLLAICSLLSISCRSLAPPLIRHDRSGIAAAIGESWQEQTLMNIVKIRYGDAPIFLDVSSVISSNSVESAGEFSATAAPNVASATDGLREYFDSLGYSAGVSRKYTDRPTITYTPLLGEEFSKNMLRPISPAAIFSLVQAGYPVDRILQFTVRAINGVYNRASSPGRERAADPKFYEMLDAMRRLQQSESISLRLVKRGPDESAVMFFADNPPEALLKDSALVHEILGLKQGANEFTLTFGAVARDDKEIAVLSRSMMEMLYEFASEVEVPEKDVKEGRTFPTPVAPDNPNPRDNPLVRIHSSRLPPTDALVSHRYRNRWFWIDDRDYASKSAFAFLNVFFSLAESGVAPQIPVVTVPIN